MGLWNKTFHFDFFPKKVAPWFKKKFLKVAIFSQFLDIQEFSKNQGVTFETSDFDFRGLFDEPFFRKKSKWQILLQSPIYKMPKSILSYFDDRNSSI